MRGLCGQSAIRAASAQAPASLTGASPPSAGAPRSERFPVSTQRRSKSEFWLKLLSTHC
jgi:hypothetical protein